MRKGAFELEVCKVALCLIHGIGKKRLERVASHLTTNITPVHDKRGRHSNRPNQISEDLKKQIHEHVNSFPKRISHYTRNRSTKYYLSSDLNISIMHDLYLEKFEADQHKLKQEGLPYKPKISYDFYGRYFRENFNIRFGTARKDTCKKCDMLNNKIQSADSEEEKSALETQKTLHLKKSEWFYTQLKKSQRKHKRTKKLRFYVLIFNRICPFQKCHLGMRFTYASYGYIISVFTLQKIKLDIFLCMMKPLPRKVQMMY